jgi:hypothetical protein
LSNYLRKCARSAKPCGRRGAVLLRPQTPSGRNKIAPLPGWRARCPFCDLCGQSDRRLVAAPPRQVETRANAPAYENAAFLRSAPCGRPTARKRRNSEASGNSSAKGPASTSDRNCHVRYPPCPEIVAPETPDAEHSSRSHDLCSLGVFVALNSYMQPMSAPPLKPIIIAYGRVTSLPEGCSYLKGYS